MTEAALDPKAFWEARYGEADRMWSGRVNETLALVVASLTPGRSLDLGCGEGGDVLWLAERGWEATGIDLSQTAIERARAEAEARGVSATFIDADLARWADQPAGVDGSERPFELVTASFLQSPAQLPRGPVLRAAAGRVAPGGTLAIIAHAAAPSWAAGHEHRGPTHFPRPEDELAELALEGAEWSIEVAEVRERAATGPEGEPGTHFDTVVVARRR
ncbi:class I SAM-dependent methyltransferase [Leucobacter albus]|uniref:Class I SAM-dependent methyltransferase n=1 Tax=Leucobacter albus TaxID=272210 RepID=A0ABW3TMU8_9MICO